MNETKRDISISMHEAASRSLRIVLPLAIFQASTFFLIHGIPAMPANSASTLFGVLLLLGILAHELIHMFSWAVFARKPLRAFKIGFQWKSLTPYAHCKELMNIQAYRVGSFAPGLLLGIVPWTISLFTGDILLFIFGLLYTTAAGGDFLILWLLRNVKQNTLVEDHPSNAGCYVYEL